jgi:hypothetical protein
MDAYTSLPKYEEYDPNVPMIRNIRRNHENFENFEGREEYDPCNSRMYGTNTNYGNCDDFVYEKDDFASSLNNLYEKTMKRKREEEEIIYETDPSDQDEYEPLEPSPKRTKSEKFSFVESIILSDVEYCDYSDSDIFQCAQVYDPVRVSICESDYEVDVIHKEDKESEKKIESLILNNESDCEDTIVDDDYHFSCSESDIELIPCDELSNFCSTPSDCDEEISNIQSPYIDRVREMSFENYYGNFYEGPE